MLRNGELKRLRPLLLFFLGYTLLFLAWVKTFFYTLPLLLGLLVAGAVQPVIRFLDGKWRWRHTASTLAATGAALGLLLAGADLPGGGGRPETAAVPLQGGPRGTCPISPRLSPGFCRGCGTFSRSWTWAFSSKTGRRFWSGCRAAWGWSSPA